MSEMYEEKPKKKKHGDGQDSKRNIAIIVALLVLSALVIVLVLAFLSPTIGNVFSNVIDSLDAAQ